MLNFSKQMHSNSLIEKLLKKFSPLLSAHPARTSLDLITLCVSGHINRNLVHSQCDSCQNIDTK